jgi:hypothetical protein
MIGTWIVFVFVLAIVSSYIGIVNWFLRHDEYYNEKLALAPQRERQQPSAPLLRPAHSQI